MKKEKKKFKFFRSINKLLPAKFLKGNVAVLDLETISLLTEPAPDLASLRRN